MCQPHKSTSVDACLKALLEPYLLRAKKELGDTRFQAMLSPACRRQLMSGLAQQLVACAQDTLSAMVTNMLSKRKWLWGINAALAPSAEVNKACGAVAAQIEATDGAVVDDVAPLLRSSLQRETDRFIRANNELLERIWQDRHRIADELLGGGAHSEIGTISALDMRLANCHDGGRRTAVVACEAGRFVYKPRNCGIDLWFAQVANKYLPDSLRQPHSIVRHDDTGHWGFAEFVMRAPLVDESGIARYWHNFGRAAALFQVLGSVDLHCENFIAVGDTPSLIDSEMVINGEPTQQGDPLTCPSVGCASRGFGRDLTGTLAGSALLPAYMGDSDNVSPLVARGRKCLPLWEGREHDVCGYEDDFLTGFEEALALLATRAEELAYDLRVLGNMPVRYMLRNTDVYVSLIDRFRRRDAYDPAKREGLLCALYRPLIRGNEATRSPLATNEVHCLLQGDIPYFYAKAGSTTIVGSDGTSDARLLSLSAQERALELIRSLDPTHHSFYKGVLEANLRRALVGTDTPLPPCVPKEEPLSVDDALNEAIDVFRKLEKLVISSPSGESSWLFRSSHNTLKRSTVEFGSGLGGMAVFLGALASRVRDERVRARACHRLTGCLDRIEEVIACLEVARVIPEQSVSFGMYDGFGGVVHALDLVIAALDGQPGMEAIDHRAHTLIRRVLGVLPRLDIEHMSHADVYAGGAGLLLALGESPAAARDGGTAELARRLARRLLDLRTIGKGARLCDTSGTSWPVSGFGRGQAGIAASLAKGTAAFGTDVDSAVYDALSFEDTVYNKRIGTWPDLSKKPASDTYLHGMCSGAPGVGLAALMVEESVVDPDVRALAQDLLERADEACERLSPHICDTLWCGNLSVVEYWLSRGGRHEAGRLLAGVVGRKREHGFYVVNPPHVRQTDEPSFLQGLAGIGYALLRYTDPSLGRVF